MTRTRTRRDDTDVTKQGEFAETLAQVEKRYGHQAVRKAFEVKQPERISTGSFMLDFALLGGIPVGRISMVIGNKSSGKSMIANKIIANAQRKWPDKTPVLIDVEKTFEPRWAAKLGVNIQKLPVIEADTGEMAVDLADAMLGTLETSLVVVDSLAALLPNREADSSAEDSHVGLQSRLIGSMCRKLNAGMIKERMRGHAVTVLFLNQYRTKIGVMKGDPRTAPGGLAVEYFPSLTFQMKNKETMGKDEDTEVESVIENEHAFKIEKNKLNPGPRTGIFRLVRVPRESEHLDEGDIDDSKTMLTYAKKFGVFSGGGKYWTLKFEDQEHKFEGGVTSAQLALNSDRALYQSLYNWLIREQAIHLGMPQDFVDSFEV